MNVGKVITAVTDAINKRSLVDSNTFALVWNLNQIQCIPPWRLREGMTLLCRLTERECTLGIGSAKWEQILSKTIQAIKSHKKESDYE